VKYIYSQDSFSKEELESIWHSRLLKDYSEYNLEKRESIIRWLLGQDLEQLDQLTSRQLAIAAQLMNYRYQILQQRYLEVEPSQAYCNLIARLGSLVMLCRKIRAWVALGEQRKKIFIDLLQATVENILKRDRVLQKQMAWIAQLTGDRNLRDALLLSCLEEYFLRPICYQPLLVEQMISFLQSSSASLCNKK
jgi:hypothetical protein